MKFQADVEPPQPMRGLEVPAEVIEALGEGERPAVTITVNGHSWRSRIAKMRGRYLIGFSKANRAAAGVDTGDAVEVEVELDTEPRVLEVPEDLTRALDADPEARAAWDALAPSHRRRHVHSIEGAKKAETRARRIEKAVAELRGSHPPGSSRQ
ncbi:MAG TPA: YdeI/OmpD-associated family protein [Solirubrobacterales bacterium]